MTAALADLAAEYADQGRGFELRNVAGGWRYYTREEFAPVVEAFVLDGQQARLTQAALETLAVVAYKQPVSRARVSAIRGVNVDGVMRTLLTRGLVEEAGEDHSTGAHLYRTSSYFLERIGVTSLDELPELAPYLPDLDDLERPRGRAGRRSRSDGSDRPRRRVSGPDLERDEDGLVRLHKLLARSGVASRRKCEELMLAGEVVVDDEVVTRLGTKVDPTTAVIRVSGRRLPPISPNVYLVLNKPVGVTSTMSDPHAERTLSDLVADRPERLFHVGRLDTDTAGLLLLTNDGEFAQRMAHPSYEVDKTYVASRRGRRVPAASSSTLLAGVKLDDGPVTVSSVKLVGGRAPPRRLDPGAGDPRGPQPDRPAPARPGRPPGPPAHPHRDRPGRARAARRAASSATDPRRAGRPARRRAASEPPCPSGAGRTTVHGVDRVRPSTRRTHRRPAG